MIKKVFLFLLFILTSLSQVQLPKEILYLFPLPNSKYVNPQTTIILKVDSRMAQDYNRIKFEVSGSKSGKVNGEIKFVNNTIIFAPENSFRENEKINVKLGFQVNNSQNFHYEFTTGTNAKISNSHSVANSIDLTDNKNYSLALEDGPTVINDVAVPSDFPVLQPIINTENTADGKLFVSIMQDSNPYIMILENDGTPYFYRKVERRARDFKLQPNGYLSRMIAGVNDIPNKWEVLDSNYNQIATYSAQDGYETDDHEFLMTNENTYLIIAIDYQVVDGMNLKGNHIQEVDIESGEVIFQWNSWDHLDYRDAPHGQDSNSDYVHMNSIAIDYDNNLLISCRNQDQCLKIDRVTGEIIWRLGGVKNDFEFINDEYEISYQHHITAVPGKPNHYTLFDNGVHRSPQFSRAVEYKIDTTNMTAEKVWELRTDPDRYSLKLGSVQRLPNGNTLVNWADPRLPKPTEADSNQQIVYDAEFSIPSLIYRIFKFDWEGQLNEPYLIIEPYSNLVRLIFNKFGDTDIVSYNIYADTFEDPTTLIANSNHTWYDIKPGILQNHQEYFIRVTGVYANGNESNFSSSEKVFVNFVNPNNSEAILGNSLEEDINDPSWIDESTTFNSALQFDGSNDYLDCGNDESLQLSNLNFTLEARIKPTRWKNQLRDGSIIAKDEISDINENLGYVLSTGGNGRVIFLIGSDSNNNSWDELTTNENSIPLNEWTHLAATFNGEEMKIFINGKEVASKTSNANVGSNLLNPLYIGNSPQWPSRSFDGIIDEVRIWNVARSESEITSTMEIELGEEYYFDENSGLVAYWPMNEGNGQLTADLAKSTNLVLNGNFSSSDDYWNLSTLNNATAVGSVNDHYYIDIENGGNTESDIIFYQNYIPLEKDQKYTLKFDGWAEQAKFIDVKIRKSTLPYTDYSRIGAVFLNDNESSYSYDFIMNETSDGNSQLVFMVGKDNTDVYFDNISLKPFNDISAKEEEELESTFMLFNNYPNPFNPSTTISFSLANSGFVELTVYNVLGEEISKLVNQKMNAGIHQVKFNAGKFTSGIYFYRLNIRGQFNTVKKMLLLK